jgi:hypothetical protein
LKERRGSVGKEVGFDFPVMIAQLLFLRNMKIKFTGLITSAHVFLKKGKLIGHSRRSLGNHYQKE